MVLECKALFNLEISTGIVCVIDKKVIDFLFNDEAKEKIYKVRRKFISRGKNR